MTTLAKYTQLLVLFLVTASATNAQPTSQTLSSEGFFLRLTIETEGQISEDVTMAITDSDASRRNESFQIEKASDSQPGNRITFSGQIEKIEADSYLLRYQLNKTYRVEIETNKGDKTYQYQSDSTESSVKLELEKQIVIIKDLDRIVTLTLTKDIT